MSSKLFDWASISLETTNNNFINVLINVEFAMLLNVGDVLHFPEQYEEGQGNMDIPSWIVGVDVNYPMSDEFVPRHSLSRGILQQIWSRYQDGVTVDCKEYWSNGIKVHIKEL